MRRAAGTPVLVLAASAVLVCAALTGGLTAPGPVGTGSVGGSAATGRHATLGPCTPTGPLDSVAQINDFLDTTAGVEGLLGADVGVDVPLPGRRSLWFFADTLRSTDSGDRLVRNSALLFAPGCVHTVRPADGGSTIPDRDDGVGYWPMSAWRLATGDAGLVYVMLQRVLGTPGSGLGFVTLGPAVALFRVAPSGTPELLMTRDLGPDNPFTAAPEWGSASALHGGWLYLYGTSTRDLPGVHGFALRVARVRPSLVADLSSWRYWDGSGWGADPWDALALIDEQGGVSQTLSVFRQDGRWYVLSKQDEFLGRHITVWPGSSPNGPFGPPMPVADLPSDGQTGELRYMPLAHPQLLPAPGTVVVSYSCNNLDLRQVCADPALYRPQFLRVTLPDEP